MTYAKSLIKNGLIEYTRRGVTREYVPRSVAYHLEKPSVYQTYGYKTLTDKFSGPMLQRYFGDGKYLYVSDYIGIVNGRWQLDHNILQAHYSIKDVGEKDYEFFNNRYTTKVKNQGEFFEIGYIFEYTEYYVNQAKLI